MSAIGTRTGVFSALTRAHPTATAAAAAPISTLRLEHAMHGVES